MAQTVTIETTVNAPVAKVWECWTEPKHITQWNFATPEWHTPRATNDLRVGGRFNSRMERKDGAMGFDFEGTYDAVVLHKQIAYTMDDGRSVNTTFAQDGKGTKIVTVFEAENQNSADMQRNGWQSILDNFKKYAESLKEADRRPAPIVNS